MSTTDPSANGTSAVVEEFESGMPDIFVSEPGPLSAEILAQLDVLDPSRVATRQGPGGRVFSYLEGAEVIDTANRIFGRGNWGYELLAMTVEGDYVYRAHPADREGLPALCGHRDQRRGLQARRPADTGRHRDRQEGRGDRRREALPEELRGSLRPDAVLQRHRRACGERPERLRRPRAGAER